MPTVSLCTVTRNRQSFFDLLASQILRQKYPKDKIEWIIIDDGDYQTIIPDMIRTSGIKILYEKLNARTPLGEKRNQANEASSGEFILNMDDDDYYPSSRTIHAVSQLLEKPYYLIAGCSSIPCLNIHTDRLWILDLPYVTSAIASTFAFRREVLELTRYDPLDNYGEEYPFLCKLDRPMIQLNPFKTVLNIAHHLNTVDKRFVERINSDYVNYINYGSDSLKEIKSNYLLAEEMSLKKNQTLSSCKNEVAIIQNQKISNSWRDLGLSSCECISLRSSQSRRSQMISHAQGLDIDIYFFDAICEKEVEQYSYGKSLLKKTQIGCTLSHLFLLNSISNNRSGDQLYLILEDDVELKPQFDAKNLLESLPFNWDIIQLGTNNPFILDILFSQNDEGSILVPTFPSSWGTFAYLINSRAARRLTSKFLVNSSMCNIDIAGNGQEFLADNLLYSNLNSYTLCSPLARSRTDHISSIGYSDDVIEKTIRASNKVVEHWYS